LKEHYLLGTAMIRAVYMRYKISGKDQKMIEELESALRILDKSFEEDHPVVKLGKHLIGVIG